jgi:hypothetical protein
VSARRAVRCRLDLGWLDLGCFDAGCLDAGCFDAGCFDAGRCGTRRFGTARGLVRVAVVMPHHVHGPAGPASSGQGDVRARADGTGGWPFTRGG